MGMVKMKSTRNQSLAVIGILAGFMVGGMLLFVKGYDLVVGLPDSSSSEYMMPFGMGFMVILGGVFLIVKIIENHWNIKLTWKF